MIHTVAFVLLSSSCVAAVQLHVNVEINAASKKSEAELNGNNEKEEAMRSSAYSAESVVCVSLLAYEDPQYVEALINNFYFFSEPTTKLALHLDAQSIYSQELLAGWESKSDNIIVSQGINAIPFTGAILAAHLQNMRSLDDKWPGVCKYFVMQHSNMMWVRKGFEGEVRLREYSGFNIIELRGGDSCADANGNDTKGAITQKLLDGNDAKGAHGVPEGAFFPMSMVRSFHEWLDSVMINQTDLLHVQCYVEEFWLQTYAVTHDQVTPDRFDTLCLRTFDETCPLAKVESVISGYQQFYAVKRVNRNLAHPTTRRILSLFYDRATIDASAHSQYTDWDFVDGLPDVEGPTIAMSMDGIKTLKDMKMACMSNIDCAAFAYCPESNSWFPKARGNGSDPYTATFSQKHPGQFWQWHYIKFRVLFRKPIQSDERSIKIM